MIYTNSNNIPLPLSVLLAYDTYEHSTDPKEISVTTLISPVRQTILKLQNPSVATTEDISSKSASVLGTALHQRFEDAWLKNHQQAMEDLGYPEKIINRTFVNPTQDQLNAYRELTNEDAFPVYLEKRTKQSIQGWTVSGQFDFVFNGKLSDLKTTGTYSFGDAYNERMYILQGSIYRWLNPLIITEDTMSILYWFKNWTKLGLVKKTEGYPPSEILEKDYPLLSLTDTTAFINRKLSTIEANRDSKQSEMPKCTPEELWMSKSSYAYFSNPAKTGRATKVFESAPDAHLHMSLQGKGIVQERRGHAKRCLYCPVSNICDQAKELVNLGLLVI